VLREKIGYFLKIFVISFISPNLKGGILYFTLIII